MFPNDRDTLRRFYIEAWQKFQNQQALNALEQQIVAVISEHPEYHSMLTPASVQENFTPEDGSTNPFLHMGLHLGLREQIATNRPMGIQAVYQQLCQTHETHHVEHKMLDCLAESIWQAQRDQQPPDENAYLECLKTIQ